MLCAGLASVSSAAARLMHVHVCTCFLVAIVRSDSKGPCLRYCAGCQRACAQSCSERGCAAQPGAVGSEDCACQVGSEPCPDRAVSCLLGSKCLARCQARVCRLPACFQQVHYPSVMGLWGSCLRRNVHGLPAPHSFLSHCLVSPGWPT